MSGWYCDACARELDEDEVFEENGYAEHLTDGWSDRYGMEIEIFHRLGRVEEEA